MIVDHPTQQKRKKTENSRTNMHSLSYKIWSIFGSCQGQPYNFRLPHQIDLVVLMSYCTSMKRE
jgi:hypothetical protein